MSNQPHRRRVFHADIPFDRWCQVGQADWPELTDQQKQVCQDGSMVPIFDAETCLVAIVPKEYADVLLEIINRFSGDPLTDDDWKIIDSVGIEKVDRSKF